MRWLSRFFLLKIFFLFWEKTLHTWISDAHMSLMMALNNSNLFSIEMWHLLPMRPSLFETWAIFIFENIFYFDFLAIKPFFYDVQVKYFWGFLRILICSDNVSIVCTGGNFDILVNTIIYQLCILHKLSDPVTVLEYTGTPNRKESWLLRLVALVELAITKV